MLSEKKGRHLLTVLVEDYFHVGAFEKLIHQRNWANFEPRFEQNTLKTLDLLDEFGAKATFFVLGWIAEQNPQLLAEIVRRGHEVASRGFYHRSLKNLTREEFRIDTERTSEAISRATGQRVYGYRAAEKLGFGKQDWIFEVLADEGFAYDSSFMPDRATPLQKHTAHQVHTNGRAMWEFPYSTINMGLGVLPISGGNYFRQIPYTLMRRAVAGWGEKTTAPFVSYFHVWELDPEQPRISAASRVNRVRHYRNLDKMEWILRENLSLYDCVSMASHLGLSDDIAPTKAGAEKAHPKFNALRPIEVRDSRIPVSIVIPCYNEAETLPYLANTLPKVEGAVGGAGYGATFIFVDDHSSDTTFAKLQELFSQKQNVEILRHDRNQGVAAGIMTGIRAARTEIVASMDCDCTYDPLGLADMLPLLSNDVDLVTASPYHRDGRVRNVPAWRLTLSKGASFLYRRVLHSKLDTYTSCFRVYRRSAFTDLELSEPGFLGVAEMLAQLDLSGGKIVEFPAVLDVRLFGASKMKTLRTIRGHVALLARFAIKRWFRNTKPIETSIPLDQRP
jgi:polysaccharide deacetylase family protein (PEP-CTERM system associated)